MREGGFTLMEVMIAIAILAIALTAVYRSQSQSVSMAANARFLTTAAAAQPGKMAEVDSRPARTSPPKTAILERISRIMNGVWRLEDGELEISKRRSN